MFNKLLQRQIVKHIGNIDTLPESYILFFKSISESYDHYEKDRQMIERSMEISSKEMIGLTSKLRKEAEEVQRVNDELNKSNLELEKFVYSVSHDLRAPLSSMKGMIEISEEETTDPLLLQNFSLLKGSVKKLDDFIQDILEYSRNSRAEIKKAEINFKEMLEEITNDLRHMSSNNERKVDISFEIHNQKHFISDKTRISMMLNNLISNAIRYQNPASENPLVNIQVNMTDTNTDIIVKDNGIGISEDNQKKIFEMFYRVSKNSVGTGLGLYLVKEIVDKLEGKIEIESEVGRGTAFYINLPNNSIIIL